MPTRSKVVVVIGLQAAESRWARRLEGPGLRLRGVTGVPVDCEGVGAATSDDDADGNATDAVLIDAAAVGPDVPRAVRSCRRCWPDPSMPLLVVNLPDVAAAAAVIDAGATDGLGDSSEAPTLVAHVHRVLRAGDAMRAALDSERLRLHHESLTRAAAEVALPLGELVDQIESAMTHSPAETPLFDELLDRVGRAVDALDRLRSGGDSPDEPH